MHSIWGGEGGECIAYEVVISVICLILHRSCEDRLEQEEGHLG